MRNSVHHQPATQRVARHRANPTRVVSPPTPLPVMRAASEPTQYVPQWYTEPGQITMQLTKEDLRVKNAFRVFLAICIAATIVGSIVALKFPHHVEAKRPAPVANVVSATDPNGPQYRMIEYKPITVDSAATWKFRANVPDGFKVRFTIRDKQGGYYVSNPALRVDDCRDCWSASIKLPNSPQFDREMSGTLLMLSPNANASLANKETLLGSSVTPLDMGPGVIQITPDDASPIAKLRGE